MAEAELTTTLTGGRARRWRPPPDIALAWGITVAVLGLLVVLPLAVVVLTARHAGLGGVLRSVSSPIALAALGLSFGGALVSAAMNAVMGTVVAWTLVRYEFPGRSLANAVVDLPFALPTAVAGITLSELFSPRGWAGALGLRFSYTPLGVLLAMTFVSLPFVVRAVQPVLEGVEREVEEAAASLGATPWQTFTRVVLPSIRPAVLTGLALSFARALGEYGSVVIISGNIPMRTLTAPVLIFERLEQYDTVGATAIATVMLVVSVATLLAVGLLQRWGRHDAA